MAKGKALLTEGEVRKFMKFANIPHLADNFLKEGSYMEEETYEEGMAPQMEEEEEMPVEEPVAEEPPVDMGMDAEEPAEEEGGMEARAKQVLGDLAALLSDLGVPASVDGDEEEMEMDAEEPADMDMPAGEEEVLGEMGVYDEEALAEAVLKRVMGRVKGLTEAKKRKAELSKRVDEVTDRIMKRITG
jgi:hypothetical protein